MDKAKLNEWAARYIGEDDDLVAEAVRTEWYTQSEGAAMAVLVKSAKEGKEVELEIEGGAVEVYCGGAEETGSIEELALLVIRACYRCHSG
jgi:hypothetical protein